MRVLAYIRVSGAEQGRHGTSLDAQREEIERYCAAHSLAKPEVYVEVESAGAEKLDRRARIRALLADVRPGDLVIVAKQDRWSRDTLFYVQSTREIVSRGARFLSLAERFDPSTPEGQFAATVMAATAEHERARIHARTVGRRKELRAQGCWIEGPPPFGYRVENRRLIIEPVEAAVVRDLFRRCIAGASVADLCEWVKQDHPRIAYRKSIGSMLRARWYLGELRTPAGVWIPAHEAIVDAATFELAAEALRGRRLGGAKGKADSKTSTWVGRGLMVCARCGARMGAAYRTGKSVQLFYYLCGGRARRRSCDQPYARVDRIDARLRELTLERLTSLRQELARGPEASTPRSRVEELSQRVDRLAARRERTIDLITDGTIEAPAGRERLAKVDAERAAAIRELADEERRAARATPAQRRAILADVETLRRAWSQSTPAVQRDILGRLAARIAVESSEVSITWRTVTELVQHPT